MYPLTKPLKTKYFKSKIVGSAYTKTESNSKIQFEHDFGCYPPSPLNTTEPSTKFSIIHLSKFGNIFYKISTLLKLQTRNPEVMNDDFRESKLVKELQESNKKIMNYFKVLKKELEKQNKIKKIATLSLLALISPFMILALTAYLFFFLCKLTLETFKEKEVRGSFCPIINNDLEILIFGKRNNKNQIDSVKSHEHLHLMQYTHKMASGEKDKIKINNPLDILTEEGAKNPYVNYIFEQDEMEARLHEFVLSFYRTHNFLPLDLDGFIRLISTSQKLSPLISEALLNTTPGTKEKKYNLEAYPVRDAQTEIDMAIIMLSIKNTGIRKKFILEVLAVMYGNLLGYYGDQGAKNNFLEGIKRPNLYDSLWV